MARGKGSKRDNSHLFTPEINAKRAKAVRRAFRLKKKAKEAAARGVLLPLTPVPGEKAPLIAYEGEDRKGVIKIKDRGEVTDRERFEMARGVTALLFKIIGGR